MSLRPRQFETIAEWGSRVLGKGATNYLLVPALGGIYAGDPERLSASLIFGRSGLPGHLRTNRPARARMRGTVAPTHGMQQLIDGLADHLKRAGVEFVFDHRAQAEASEPTAVCLSARSRAEFLAGISPEASHALRRIEMLSLVPARRLYAPEADRLKAVGSLFSLAQGFSSRGVVF